jgi:hypothetical protein
MNWDPRHFRRMCREADKRARKKLRDPRTAFLLSLLDEDKHPSLDAVYRALGLERRKHGANEPTVEALVLGLRRGLSALDDGANMRRLSELNDKQFAEVCARLRRFMPHIAPAWSDAAIEKLLVIREGLRHG